MKVFPTLCWASLSLVLIFLIDIKHAKLKGNMYDCSQHILPYHFNSKKSFVLLSTAKLFLSVKKQEIHILNTKIHHIFHHKTSEICVAGNVFTSGLSEIPQTLWSAAASRTQIRTQSQRFRFGFGTDKGYGPRKCESMMYLIAYLSISWSNHIQNEVIWDKYSQRQEWANG